MKKRCATMTDRLCSLDMDCAFESELIGQRAFDQQNSFRIVALRQARIVVMISAINIVSIHFNDKTASIESA
jgi:hypothetical protein